MKRVWWVLLLVLLTAVSAHAADAQKTDALKKVKKMPIMGTLFGDQLQLLEAKDRGSLYEVVAVSPNRGKQILYVTKDGSYVILGGNLINKDRVNVTKERFEEVTKVDVAKLPLQDAVVVVKGNGAKKLFMFSDVDCPYCRKAYEWLKTQDNFTLYVFLIPLDMHPKAHEKTVQILCSQDPVATLDLVHGDQGLSVARCEAGEQTVERLKKLAAELGVDGTPLFVTGTGKRISGFSQAAIQEYLKN